MVLLDDTAFLILVEYMILTRDDLVLAHLVLEVSAQEAFKWLFIRIVSPIDQPKPRLRGIHLSMTKILVRELLRLAHGILESDVGLE